MLEFLVKSIKKKLHVCASIKKKFLVSASILWSKLFQKLIPYNKEIHPNEPIWMMKSSTISYFIFNFNNSCLENFDILCLYFEEVTFKFFINSLIFTDSYDTVFLLVITHRKSDGDI